MRGRRLVVGITVAIGLLGVASPAAAHPLGNATVSRALAVELGSAEARITAVVDMAEIPAFATLLELDTDGDAVPSDAEQVGWAAGQCGALAADIHVSVDDQRVEVTDADAPDLTFPPGVGGLQTLRLVCHLNALIPDGGAQHHFFIADRGEVSQRGWHEVTIAAVDDLDLLESDVPSASPSALLTNYPDELQMAPVDVRAGTAVYAPTSGPARATLPAPSSGAAGAAARDPLADLVAVPRTPGGWLAALALALGLGAAHALSPGHGKALIAAYAVGSRSTLGHTVGLGLSAAASHTVGVLVLGAIVLTAGELLVPERVVAWLSVASGIGVVAVGGMVAGRALRRQADAPDVHPHGDGEHGHAHQHMDGGQQPHAGRHAARPPLHEIITLGLVGGAIPSTSAVLVLLVAVATGQLVQGLFLIVAFGAGMAIVLGGLAAITGLARTRLIRASGRAGLPSARRLAGAAPIASAVVIMAVGALTAIGALGSLL